MDERTQMDRRDALKVLGTAATVPFIGSNVSQQSLVITDKYEGMSGREKIMAVLRDNQRKHDPSLIPQMENLFTDTNLWDWVSIQPATDEEAKGYSLEFKNKDGSRPVIMDARDGSASFENEIMLVVDSCLTPIDRRISQTDLKTRDLERLVINEIRKSARHKLEWNFATALGDTILEKYESLYIKLVEMSNVIHRTTLRGGANRIITSPEISAFFETAHKGLKPSDLSELAKVGIVKVGTVNNRWYLYKDPLWPVKNGPILTFYAGDTVHIDRGCVFMPLHLEDENTLRYGISIKPEFAGMTEVQNFII